MGSKGKGLNSIPVRFGLMGALIGGLSLVGPLWLVGAGLAGWPFVLSIAISVIVASMIMVLAARSLTMQIEALHRSTEALVAGDFNTPVDVDCACEVGGLADSFRKMVNRLNSNIVRMNVLAYADGVTGLPNRAVVFHLLARLTEDPENKGASVLFIDLDGFKRVNDVHGHETGDELLRLVSVRIAEALGQQPDMIETCMTPMGELCDAPPRKTVIARVSGDEFVVILPDAADDPELASCGILNSLETHFEIGSAKVQVGASIGIARFPKDATTPEDLLNMADLAMYEAKRAGRGRTVAVCASLRTRWQERRDVEGDLSRAIECGEITIAYQPRFSTKDLSCVALEALARWNHPQRGSISPGVFVPIAEQAGLMPLLGATVFENAVKQCRIWQDQGLSLLVSVNVSAAEFEDRSLVPRLLSVLQDHRVDPRMIEIEITETMAMGDFELTQEQMMALRNAGLRIAIDDFGTGYSNLSQLSRLPYTSMKLDRSLILDVTRRESGLDIFRAVCGMAKALGHVTIAEGIETQEQYNALASVGCDEVQGFLFAKPMDPDAIPDLVARSRSQGALSQQA